MNNSKTKKIPRVEDKTSNKKTHALQYWKHHRAAFLLFFFSLIAAFPYKTSRSIESYPQRGEVSQETVIAPFTYEIPKEEVLLNREISQKQDEVRPVFMRDSSSIPEMKKELDTLVHFLTILNDTSNSDSLHLVAAAAVNPVFSGEEVRVMAKYLPLVTGIRDSILAAARQGISSHVLVNDIPSVEKYRELYDARFKYILTKAVDISELQDSGEINLPISSVIQLPILYHSLFRTLEVPPVDKSYLASALYNIFETMVKPTLVYNTVETEKRRVLAKNGVRTYIRKIPKNVEIVRKHQIVTPTIAENLDALQKEYDDQFSSIITVKVMISQFTTLLLLFMLAFILFRLLKDLIPRGIDRVTYFNVISLIVAVSFLIIRLGAYFTNELTPENAVLTATLVYTAIPMVVGSLLAGALFNKESGFVLAIFFAVFGGVLGGYDPIIPVGTIISGGIVSGLAASMRYRRDFFTMVIWITLTNFLIGTTMTLVSGEPSVKIFSLTAVFAIVNALSTVALSFFLLPLFEQFFHITTDMTLMELADMNHPLLKRLAIEAPGTYNHSIMVANLAEAAADAIGADALLCRVVSYYHDIGKLKKPHNFIENQYSKKNVHDRISPSMSVRIITGHVREGLELADEFKLPQAIKDVIPQHHGDAPLAFFYHKAMEEKGENEEIDIRDYSYGGPKPQTRENAVVMIADSVEAASRTMKSTTIKDIREMVKKIIWGKISHNQLDESGLDLNDLSEMVNGMMPILEGVYHSRIEYPEEEEKEDG